VTLPLSGLLTKAYLRRWHAGCPSLRMGDAVASEVEGYPDLVYVPRECPRHGAPPATHHAGDHQPAGVPRGAGAVVGKRCHGESAAAAVTITGSMKDAPRACEPSPRRCWIGKRAAAGDRIRNPFTTKARRHQGGDGKWASGSANDRSPVRSVSGAPREWPAPAFLGVLGTWRCQFFRNGVETPRVCSGYGGGG